MASREPLRSYLPWGCAAVWKRLRHLGLNIQRQESSPSDITLTVESSRSGAQCPLCGRVSRRKHSRYTRFLMDLPADGRTVNIHLTVRRFRCNNPTCRRRVFAERFPQFVRPHARRTKRLDDLLTRIGVLLGGEAGARLAQDLHAPVSPDTILRLIYCMEITPVANLRVVGIDDWAWRKGVRYGTIVCDLETRRPVDLLPETRTEVLAQWLARYPGIEVVTRDRAGVYADGAALGAPHAMQVADRWHLLRNLGDVAERVLVGVSIPPIPLEPAQPVEIVSASPQPSARETRREVERRQRHQRRQALYEQVHELYRKTHSICAVATQLGIDRRTVRRYLDAPECPLPKPRGKRTSILDPYRSYILARWQEGCHNAAALGRVPASGVGMIGVGSPSSNQLAVCRKD
ncbi:MAG: ISL3 family transposase [Bacillota bacterium]|nr:MAG: ISL3 family transposase [Bacillota bacterium]